MRCSRRPTCLRTAKVDVDRFKVDKQHNETNLVPPTGCQRRSRRFLWLVFVCGILTAGAMHVPLSPSAIQAGPSSIDLISADRCRE